MLSEYIQSLAVEYLNLIKMMKSGDYDGAAYAELSSQRTTTHDELVRVLGDGYERPFDMRKFCQELLAESHERS